MNWIWIGVIVSLIFIEVLSLNFTAIWFVIGGIVGYVLMKLEFDYIIQVLGFFLTGVLFIMILRPKIIKNLIEKRDSIIKNVTKKHPFLIHFVPSEIRIQNNTYDKNKKKNKKAIK
jgi:membrane protein implicated in regulation of membrane protease activity